MGNCFNSNKTATADQPSPKNETPRHAKGSRRRLRREREKVAASLASSCSSTEDLSGSDRNLSNRKSGSHRQPRSFKQGQLAPQNSGDMMPPSPNGRARGKPLNPKSEAPPVEEPPPVPKLVIEYQEKSESVGMSVESTTHPQPQTLMPTAPSGLAEVWGNQGSSHWRQDTVSLDRRRALEHQKSPTGSTTDDQQSLLLSMSTRELDQMQSNQLLTTQQVPGTVQNTQSSGQLSAGGPTKQSSTGTPYMSMAHSEGGTPNKDDERQTNTSTSASRDDVRGETDGAGRNWSFSEPTLIGSVANELHLMKVATSTGALINYNSGRKLNPNRDSLSSASAATPPNQQSPAERLQVGDSRSPGGEDAFSPNHLSSRLGSLADAYHQSPSQPTQVHTQYHPPRSSSHSSNPPDSPHRQSLAAGWSFESMPNTQLDAMEMQRRGANAGARSGYDSAFGFMAPATPGSMSSVKATENGNGNVTGNGNGNGNGIGSGGTESGSGSPKGIANGGGRPPSSPPLPPTPMHGKQRSPKQHPAVSSGSVRNPLEGQQNSFSDRRPSHPQAMRTFSSSPAESSTNLQASGLASIDQYRAPSLDGFSASEFSNPTWWSSAYQQLSAQKELQRIKGSAGEHVDGTPGDE